VERPAVYLTAKARMILGQIGRLMQHLLAEERGAGADSGLELLHQGLQVHLVPAFHDLVVFHDQEG
jgi:hypothetical protein